MQGIGIDDEMGDIVGAGRGFDAHIVAVAGVGEYISDAVDVFLFLFLMVVSCWGGLMEGIGIDAETGDIVGSGNGLDVHIVAVAGVGEYIRDGVVVVSYGC